MSEEVQAGSEDLKMTKSVYVFVAVLAVCLLVVRRLVHGTKKENREIEITLRDTLSVHSTRVEKVMKELRRKAFHMAGFIIPSCYIATIHSGFFTHSQASLLLGVLAGIQWAIEITRKISPTFDKFVISKMKRTMREEELKSGKITGTPFFMTGNFLAVYLFSPTLTVVAQMYLLVGDLCAALVGIAYGSHKIYGNKSIEGTLGCFFSCLFTGSIVMAFSAPHFSVGLVLALNALGAAVATVAELVAEDFYINDNLAIPIFGGYAIHFAAKFMGLPLVGPEFRL